jgi:predicted  nucleic acid-binding Zn-ribbon protein
MAAEFKKKVYRCEACGHVWSPRSEEVPERCAGCKSRTWNVVRKNSSPPKDIEPVADIATQLEPALKPELKQAIELTPPEAKTMKVKPSVLRYANYQGVQGEPNSPATPGELERWGDLERPLSNAEINAMSATEMMRRAKARTAAREARGLSPNGTPKGWRSMKVGNDPLPQPEPDVHYNDYRAALTAWYRRESTEERWKAKEMAFEEYRREYQEKQRSA